MNTLEIILSVLTAAFGAGNVWQFFTLRSLKRVKASEADQAQIATLNNIIDSQNRNYDSLQSRYDRLQEKYDVLIEKYDQIQQQLLELSAKVDKKTKSAKRPNNSNKKKV